MENNETNLKPQQTGGLKLMTVFIAVLALHVIVIGGFTVYHLLSASSTDQDVALDKTHKTVKVLPDGSLAGDLPATDSTDKTITSAPTSTDSAAAPATASTENASAPATDTTATPAPAAPVTSAPATTTSASAPAAVAETEPAPSVITPTAQTPSGPIRHGPVIDPPENLAPDASSTAASPASADAPATEGMAYTVKPGDSLARIARQHHVSLAKLRAANSFSSDMLHIGQKVTIPNRAQTVALTANTESPATADATTASTPTHHLARMAAASTGGHHLYTVVKGDTLMKIARRFRTTSTALMTANNLTSAGHLSIGKKLKIPSGESRSAAASSPAPAPVEAKAAPKGQLANFVQ